jgi:predicted nucleic acid-binding protein
MIVADASFLSPVVGDDGPVGEAARRALAGEPECVLPSLADIEVVSVLRKHALAGLMDEARCLRAIQYLADLPFPRYEAGPLLGRAFALRNTLTVYDAVYVALAEQVGATLVTMDGRLARAPGIPCKVRLFQP